MHKAEYSARTHTGPKKVKLSLKRIHYAKLEEGMSLFQRKKKKGDLRIQTNFFCKGRWGKVIEFANLKIQDRNLNCLKSCDSVC